MNSSQLNLNFESNTNAYFNSRVWVRLEYGIDVGCMHPIYKNPNPKKDFINPNLAFPNAF
jgi:hypothetical protein